MAPKAKDVPARPCSPRPRPSPVILLETSSSTLDGRHRWVTKRDCGVLKAALPCNLFKAPPAAGLKSCG
jgi:hypothetical protein